MVNPKATPSFCVVIEWDNARLSEMVRGRRMLAELFRQMQETDAAHKGSGSVIVAYDALAIDENNLQRVVLDHAGDAWAERVGFAPREGARYYELKNFGAKRTDSELLVFLDSDVIPEPGWLRGLLAGFGDPGVDVVCGGTFVSLDSLYGKAFALFWFFPLRRDGQGLRKVRHFFANNVAFRREVFARYPFPELEQSRGQCVALAEMLVEKGVGLFRQDAAWVAHPPPNGIRHFCRRAVTQGHDRLADVQRNGGRSALALRTTYWALADNLRSALARIRAHFREVGLGRAGAAYAVLLAVIYYSLMAAGEVVTRASPGFVRRFLLV